MRFTTYSKYKGKWLDALNLESLLEHLSDFLMDGGFAGGPHYHPYWGWSGDEDVNSTDSLKNQLLRALMESGQLTPEIGTARGRTDGPRACPAPAGHRCRFRVALEVTCRLSEAWPGPGWKGSACYWTAPAPCDGGPRTPSRIESIGLSSPGRDRAHAGPIGKRGLDTSVLRPSRCGLRMRPNGKCVQRRPHAG